MAQPVWVLSVDLQTKTATFQSGMADAAKSARGAFNDIKQGAGEAGERVGYSMMEARHGVMLLGEEFGVHLPRALTSFIASIGPIGAAMEAAFPFLAIIVGATLLIEHLHKLKEEDEKLAESQAKFTTATHNAFNALDSKMLQAQIRADELNKDHLAALHHQLELIDHQSLEELVRSFEIVAKAADVVFAELKSHWYTFGVGAEGAKHSLDTFKAEYGKLIAIGNSAGAHTLLDEKVKREERILALQKQYLDNQTNADTGKARTGNAADYDKFVEAHKALDAMSIGIRPNEVKAQETLVEALRDQVTIEEKISSIKHLQQDNSTQSTGQTMAAEASRRLIAQLKAENEAIAAREKEAEENRLHAVANLQETEREKIEATQKGGAERLAAIDEAIREENTKGLQETGFYRSLLVQRIEVIRQMDEEEQKLRTQAGNEAAEHELKMNELKIAADRERQQLLNSMYRATDQERVQQEIQIENEEFAVKMAAYAREISALDKHARDHENKLKALQDREIELTKAHENKITEIKDKAQEQQNARIAAGIQRMEETFAHGFTEVIMRHQSFASMMSSIGDQILSGIINHAIMSALMMDFGKEKDAAKAARLAFTWGWEHGGPAAPVLAPALGAMAFAAEMAFAEGGLVPGFGNGDVVPAMLTPGEHVASKELTEGLSRMVRDGGAGARETSHVHIHNTYHVSALDSDGMDEVLQRHNDTLVRHVQSAVRRMNH